MPDPTICRPNPAPLACSTTSRSDLPAKDGTATCCTATVTELCAAFERLVGRPTGPEEPASTGAGAFVLLAEAGDWAGSEPWATKAIAGAAPLFSGFPSGASAG